MVCEIYFVIFVTVTSVRSQCLMRCVNGVRAVGIGATL